MKSKILDSGFVCEIQDSGFGIRFSNPIFWIRNLGFVFEIYNSEFEIRIKKGESNAGDQSKVVQGRPRVSRSLAYFHDSSNLSARARGKLPREV